MDDEECDLYEMALGGPISSKKEPVLAKTCKEKQMEQPDYAALFRELLVGSRAQIGQLKEENEKLKTNLQNALKSGGVVVCPNCTHHFNDRLCLLRPRTMKKMRARNCVELEFSTEDDLEAWLHLNQLETNNDGLPTVFKVKKNQEVKNNSLEKVGSLLPKLVEQSNLPRIPKKRSAEKEEVKEHVRKKKRSNEIKERERKIDENLKHQKKNEENEPRKKEVIPIRKEAPKPKPHEEVRIPLQNRVKMPEKSEKAEKAPIVWNDASAQPPNTSTKSVPQFSFKISERTHTRKEKAPPAKVEKAKEVEPAKEKFKFVPTAMKKDPREVQSTSKTQTVAQQNSDKCKKESEKSGTNSISSFPVKNTVESVGKLPSATSSVKVPNSKISNATSSESLHKLLNKTPKIAKRRSQSPEATENACSIKSLPNVTQQKPPDCMGEKSPHLKPVIASLSISNDTHEKPKASQNLKPDEKAGKSEKVPSISKCPKKQSPGGMQSSMHSSSTSKALSDSTPKPNGFEIIHNDHPKVDKPGNPVPPTLPPPSNHNFAAPKTPISWNQIRVKKSPEVLRHQKLHAERRRIEGRRHVGTMIVVDQRAHEPRGFSLENLGMSKEGLEILKRLKRKEDPVEQASKDGVQKKKTESSSTAAPGAVSHGTTAHDNSDEDLMKEFFPDIYHAKRIKRQNSEFETDVSETASVFADREELELLDLVRVESVVPPSGDNKIDDEESDGNENDDFCLEDVEMTVTDEMRERILSENTSEDNYDMGEPVDREESKMLEMNLNFRLSDDEDAISPATSTPKPSIHEDDEDEDFTMKMREDSFQEDELDWNYGSDEDAAINPEDDPEEDLEDGELSDEPEDCQVAPRRRSTEENQPSEQEKTVKKGKETLLKRRN